MIVYSGSLAFYNDTNVGVFPIFSTGEHFKTVYEFRQWALDKLNEEEPITYRTSNIIINIMQIDISNTGEMIPVYNHYEVIKNYDSSFSGVHRQLSKFMFDNGMNFDIAE